MFFYSHGSLNALVTRQSLYTASTTNGTAANTNEGCVYKCPDPKPILVVKNILKTFENRGRNFTTFVLYDGQNVAFGLVVNSLINQSLSYNRVDVEFKEGTVIQLHEYSITNSKNNDFCSVAGQMKYLINCLDNAKVVMVILEKFFVLGNDESIQRNRLEKEAREKAIELERAKLLAEEDKRLEERDKQWEMNRAKAMEQWDRVIESAIAEQKASKKPPTMPTTTTTTTTPTKTTTTLKTPTKTITTSTPTKTTTTPTTTNISKTSCSNDSKKENAAMTTYRHHTAENTNAEWQNDNYNDDDAAVAVAAAASAAAAKDDDDDDEFYGDGDDDNVDGDNDEVEKNEEIEEYEPHKICDLCTDISRSKWSLRACLSQISSVRPFDNKQNGSSGKTMRVQLYDETGYIELAFFNEFCDAYSSNNKLKLNTVYTIRNADIRKSKKTLKLWPGKFNSFYDLYFNKHTTISIDSNQKSIAKEFMNDDNKSHERHEQQQQQQQLTRSNNDAASREPGFIDLAQLYDYKHGSLINTTGIVTKIGELDWFNRTGKPSLALRRVEIIDNTVSRPVKVALWGKQAKECELQHGHIYLFTDAELTNYAGRSLSIIKKSGFLNVTGYFNVKGVEKLAMWWRENKSRFKEQKTLEESLNDSSKRKREEDDNFKENQPPKTKSNTKKQKYK